MVSSTTWQVKAGRACGMNWWRPRRKTNAISLIPLIPPCSMLWTTTTVMAHPCKRWRHTISWDVYSDMQLTGEAINVYRKALDIDCKDDTPQFIPYGQEPTTGLVKLMYQNMYREVYPYFIKSYNFSKLTGNITIEIYSLRMILWCLIELKQMNCGISCFNRAAHQALETNNNDIYKVVMEELAAIYLKTKIILKRNRQFTHHTMTMLTSF